MKTETITFKLIGAALFICGGLIGGSSQSQGTFFSKLPLLSVIIAILIMSIGIAVWKSKKTDEPD